MKLKPEYQPSGRVSVRDENFRPVADFWGPPVTGLSQEQTDKYVALFLASEEMLEALKEIANESEPSDLIDARVLHRHIKAITEKAITKATDYKK